MRKMLHGATESLARTAKDRDDSRSSLPHRVRLRRSLSFRLLLLTVGLVVVAELLVLIPEIARDRRVILREKVLQAYIAALSSDAPANATALAQRNELLHASGIESIRLRDARGTTLVLAGDPAVQPSKSFDLREETTPQALQRGIIAVLANEDMLVRIIADSPFRPDTEIEFVMHRMPLTLALRELDAPDAWTTLGVASSVGLFLYLALLVLLVRPMRRLTSSIAAFRADPEHGVPLDPSAVSVLHDDEISLAGRELAEMQRELRAALWRNARLAAVGTVVAKVSHDMRGVLTPMLLHADRLSRHADPAVRHAGEALVQGVERAIDLVHRTLEFAARDRRRLCCPRSGCGPWWQRPATACAGCCHCFSSRTIFPGPGGGGIATICSECWSTCCAMRRRRARPGCVPGCGITVTRWRSTCRMTVRGCRRRCGPACSGRSPGRGASVARAWGWQFRAT